MNSNHEWVKLTLAKHAMRRAMTLLLNDSPDIALAASHLMAAQNRVNEVLGDEC